MLQAIKNEANYTYTENGAMTYASTMDHCLDLFATVGGLRCGNESEIESRFARAYAEDPETAMKILFYARDIRGGLGERRIFRVALKYFCETHTASVIKNFDNIAEFGRYDDFLVMLDTPCEEAAIAYLKNQLMKDMEAYNTNQGDISLLAKWLPSVNTSNRIKVHQGRKLAKAFGMSEKEYRQTLSALRKAIDIIENHLREEDYTFDYAKQCGKAMLKYRNAFYVHDEARYTEFLNKVERHEAVLHTETLMPYEIVRPFFKGCHIVSRANIEVQLKALETTWYAQEDFAGDQNALVVIDGSGSMYGFGEPKPAEVAMSLGLYFAERNTGSFANHFITFSSRPRLIEIEGNDLYDKLQYISTFNEMADTNIQAVFELILNAAVRNHIPQSEMPERIYIVSDMEFNYCAKNASMTNFEYAKTIFENAGYKLPQVVFWNVASRALQVPVTKNEQGVTLVSGCNARLFQQVLSEQGDPLSFMMEIIGSARYDAVVA